MPEHQESGDEKAEADGEQSEGRAGGPRQQEVWCDRGVAKSDPRDILRPLCNILEPPHLHFIHHQFCRGPFPD